MPPTDDLLGRSFIGNRPGPENGKPFCARDPSTGNELAPAFAPAGAEDAQRAADLAGTAFAQFRRMSGPGRAAFLRTIAENLESAAERLIARTSAETALPEARCRAELARTTGQLRFFADLVAEGSWTGARIDHADPDRRPAPKPDTRFLLQPLGPVAVFGPANFPLAFGAAGGDTASALAAGCPVIVKAHSSHPGTAEFCARAVLEAAESCGLPDGVFSLLHGSGAELGPVLVTHPCVKAVGFTGSEKAGRALFDLAAGRPDPIPVFAEMGSLNPVFILPGALRDRCDEIADGLHASVTLGCGQFCTKPGLVVMEKNLHSDAFAARVTDRMAASPAGVLLNSSTLASYRDRLRALAGYRASPEIAAAEHRAHPAVFQAAVGAFTHDPVLREETFGPATVLLTAGSRAEVLDFAAGLGGHLTATIHGTEEDLRAWRGLVEILETKAGRIVFNGFPTGVEVCASMNHSGPYPASTDARFTSVGTAAILRFVRPVCFQNFPQDALPPELQDDNPLGIHRLVDNRWTPP